MELTQVDSCQIYRPVAQQRRVRKSLCIGVGHKSRMGKNVVVDHLVKTFKDKLDVRSYAFADDLKVELYDFAHFQRLAFPSLALLSNLPGGQTLSATRLEKIAWFDANRKKLRTLAQLYGTEFRRAQDPFYWSSRLAEQIRKDEPDVALISDMRFANEARMCDITIQVMRNGFKLDPAVGKHVSETSLDLWPYTYTIKADDGDLATLKRRAAQLFEKICYESRLI
jgi:hypothetical protein